VGRSGGVRVRGRDRETAAAREAAGGLGTRARGGGFADAALARPVACGGDGANRSGRVGDLSRLLEHASPAVMLSLYAHEFSKVEHSDRMREKMEAAYGACLGDRQQKAGGLDARSGVMDARPGQGDYVWREARYWSSASNRLLIRISSASASNSDSGCCVSG